MTKENTVEPTPQPLEGKAKKKKWAIVGITVVILLILFSCIGMSFLIYYSASGNKSSVFDGQAIGVIRINGVIGYSSGDGGLVGSASSADPEIFASNLQDAVEDDSIKAILIRVNSPGGSPAASQEMYEEVMKAAKKKPVIASVADVAASGSYYAISPAQEIMAVKSSDIGSIGVFAEIPNLQELYKKIGVKFDIVKEGKYKTMGDPSKPLTSEERKIIQSIINEIYNQFIEDVAVARKPLDLKEVKELATGRTWVATQAKELGLIDSLGNFQDAITKAGKLGKIKGRPEVVYFDETDFFSIFSDGVSALKNVGRLPSETRSYK